MASVSIVRDFFDGFSSENQARDRVISRYGGLRRRLAALGAEARSGHQGGGAARADPCSCRSSAALCAKIRAGKERGPARPARLPAARIGSSVRRTTLPPTVMPRTARLTMPTPAVATVCQISKDVAEEAHDDSLEGTSAHCCGMK